MLDKIEEDPQILKITKQSHEWKIEEFKTRKTEEFEKSSEHFLSVIFFLELAEGFSEETEVFFKRVQGPFLESRAVPPSKRDVCSEAPSPISSTSVGDFQSVKILDVSSPTLAAFLPTPSSSPR
jgi:hypothetical protein